jgi:hypothetical protein
MGMEGEDMQPDEQHPNVPFATFGNDNDCMVDAETLASALGLSPATLMAELQAGLVYQVAERGIDEDCGRMRLTFRYRQREVRVIVDRAGYILDGIRPAGGGTKDPEVASCA